jgi:uncharacterized membrane protein
MRRFLGPLLLAIILAGVAHIGVVLAMPHIIMSIAVKRIAERTGGVNTLMHMPLVTPKNQSIVRSSPDLAYSVCALDLSEGPVRVRIGKGQDYASAALYASNTDNVFTLNDKAMASDGVELIVLPPDIENVAGQRETVVRMPSTKGLLLIRRLAPNSTAFERVAQERLGDQCTSVLR